MQYDADWRTSREVGCFLRNLFGGNWKPGLLARLAEMPSGAAGEGCFAPHSGGAPKDGIRLDVLLRGHEAAAGILRKLPEETAFERFLSRIAGGKELEALETFLELGVGRIDSLSPAETRDMLLFLMSRLRHIPLPSSEAVRRFLRLCRDLHMFVVCSGNFIPRVLPIFFRARAQATRIGDEGEAALFDLLIGSLNVCNLPEHNSPRFHVIMARGKATLDRLGTPELFEAAAPYLGIFHFIEGEYEQAMNLFSVVSRKLRIQERYYFEMFYVRHWAFSAANRGNFDLAANLLLSRLRQVAVRGGTSLSLSVRSQLASLYLRIGKSEKALEQLDIALIGITKKTDITSAVTTLRHLAYYHVLSGNCGAAYKILQPVLGKAEALGYQRPLYLNGILLEVLAALHEKGFPPLPCYAFEDELARCLAGPNLLLRGVAFRVKGNLLEQMGKKEEAAESYRRSISTLDAIRNPLEADKSRLRLALLLLEHNENEAALLAREAWASYPYLKAFFWPAELTRLVPAQLRSGEENRFSSRSLVEAYRDTFSPRRPGISFEVFARILLTESGRLMGADGGWLWHLPSPSARLRMVEQVGDTGGDAFPVPATVMELAEIVAEGEPVILDNVGRAEGAAGRSLFVGLPIDCRPYGVYVLCHIGGFSEGIREILGESLLGDIGKVLAWACMQVLHMERDMEHALSPSEEQREMIYSSPEMLAFLKDVDNASGTDAAILLNGESGTGKEVLARRIHERGGRNGRLVTINMASLQDDLFESEFFGHEKGSFTGAMNSKLGLVELAENGTLFLDELTEASPRVQAKLLRVLQERSFLRVGGTRPISINFRLVAATNRNLGEAVRKGEFRADLYYRVAVICLKVPPLRERRQDILPLARYYLHFFAHRHRRDCLRDFSEADCRRLEQWPWPGNIRELRNVIEQSVILSGGRRLFFHEGFAAVPFETGEASAGNERSAPDRAWHEKGPEEELSLEELEKRHILSVLNKTGWRIDGKGGALSILKISRSALYAKIRRYGLRQ